MRRIALAHQADWDGFRTAARSLALAGAAPEDVVWTVGEEGDLFGEAGPPPGASGSFNVPRALVELAQLAALARDPERFGLIYRLIFRAHEGERRLMEQTTDAQLRRVALLAQSVRRDMHKMRAFVRFREVREPAGVRYVAWFEPDHYIVEANAPFFARRFATMQWSILTPYRSAHWSGSGDVALGPGADRADVPDDDRLEAHWRTYFSAIFNPARLKVGAMTSEMPRKYWRNLPEAAAIPDLIRAAQGRVDEMLEQQPVTEMPLATTPTIAAAAPHAAAPDAAAAPGAATLPETAREAALCRRCKLWEPATQTVFGEGPHDARIMLVGEQPGDQEDLAGRPFVGPAGQLLDRALAEAGLDRRTLYVTNAVKHFKFEPRGRRRIHQSPDRAEVVACKVWLDAERAQVRPSLIVLMGATAARAVLDRAVTIGRERGRAIPAGADTLFVTVHPSYLLRLPDAASKAREYAAFVQDLKTAASIAAGSAASGPAT